MNWEKNVRKVVPYVAGEQPKDQNVIKLNTNENPYPPAPGVANIIQNFDCEVLRKYPDLDMSALVDALSAYHGLDSGQVFVGVGSDDVLAMSFLTFLIRGSRYCSRILRILFMMYGRTCSGYPISVRRWMNIFVFKKKTT